MRGRRVIGWMVGVNKGGCGWMGGQGISTTREERGRENVWIGEVVVVVENLW